MHQAEIKQVKYDLEQIQKRMDRLILATPTGNLRNTLTDVNIRLMITICGAQEAIEECNGKELL